MKPRDLPNVKQVKVMLPNELQAFQNELLRQ